MSARLSPKQPYRVQVSLRFVILSLLSCLLVAFAIGHIARVVLVENPQTAMIEAVLLADSRQKQEQEQPDQMKLPTPILPAGKILPRTTYTSKAFDTARSSINSRWVVTEEGRKQCVDLSDSECSPADPLGRNESDLSSTVKSEQGFAESGKDIHHDEIHMPQGQHLLVDIENIDASFLNSEERLAQAMLDLVYECGLTLLSYHCHGLEPSGVSCAGVLLESHVSFHTWPAEGVITLDLFTCGDESLLPVVPLAQKLFSIPRPGSSILPQMVWAHKYRGFGDDVENEKAELTDFFNFPLGIMTEYKEQIFSEVTDFQRVDVVDVLKQDSQSKESYAKSLSDVGSYEAAHPEFFEPDRIVFLDGVLQSRRSGDAAYHEALVHPGMFAHPNPTRVAIIGGGEGATLREVLKHNTVEKVIMIEIDEKMVSISRDHLPQWSDCSMLEGIDGSCFEDPRVEVYFEDAFAWFIDRYGENTDGTSAPFDIVIMDALDPQIQKKFVDALYDDGPFLSSLPAAISDDGVLIAQVGEAPDLISPPENIGLNRNRVNFIRTLSSLGFDVVRDYEESHCGFMDPWQIIAASKSFGTMGRWVADSSLVQYEMRKRIIPMKNGGLPLFYFDGSTMNSYAFPAKASEVVFCRQHQHLENCKTGHGFNQEKENIPIGALKLQTDNESKEIVASQDIPELSYIGLEHAVNGVYLKASTLTLLERLAQHSLANHVRTFIAFIHAFGHRQRRSDLSELIVQTSLHAFINEGCGEAINMGVDAAEEEENFIYNPMRDRQIHVFHAASPNSDIASSAQLLYKNNDENCA